MYTFEVVMFFQDQGLIKTTRKRRIQKRKNKVDKVDSIFTSILKINETLTDVPGMLAATKDTQEGLEVAEKELRNLGEETLPVVNIAGRVLTGAFAIGSFFIVKEIIKETKNV